MLTNLTFVVKYLRYAKAMRKPSGFFGTRSEREVVKALCRMPASHFQAAREDRAGFSRYRGSKMPIFR